MSPQPRTYRQLQPEGRVTLASLRQQNYSVREIASVLGRSASTISRELRRNASADQINGRPRKGLGVRSPLAVYRELLLNSPQHSTLIH